MNTIYVMLMLFKCYMLSLYLIINEFLFICLCLYVSMGISTWLVQGGLYLIGTERIVDESICTMSFKLFSWVYPRKNENNLLLEMVRWVPHMQIGRAHV